MTENQSNQHNSNPDDPALPANETVINLEHERQDILGVRKFDASRRRYQFALALIDDNGKNLTVADIGGGAGEFTQLLRNQGYNTLLVDGNANSVATEQKKGSDAVQADLNVGLNEIPDCSVDGAVSLEVIEHIVPAEHLLREIFRIVKPGGFVVISTPNFSYVLDRIAYLFGKDVKEEGYHFRFYTKRKLRDMISAAGFEIVETQSFGGVIGINFLLKLVTFGKLRLPPVAFPSSCESLLARTFVYRLRRS